MSHRDVVLVGPNGVRVLVKAKVEVTPHRQSLAPSYAVPANLVTCLPSQEGWRRPTEEDKQISRFSWKRIKTRGRYVVVVQRFLDWAREERWQLETRGEDE